MGSIPFVPFRRVKRERAEARSRGEWAAGGHAISRPQGFCLFFGFGCLYGFCGSFLFFLGFARVALAVRLAAAELVAGGEEPLPLIFDDSFVLYDRKRLRAALRHLAGLSQQILIFTCRTDEGKILEEEGITSEAVRIDTL